MKKLFFFISVILFTKNILAQNNVFGYSLKAGISVGKIAILPPLQNRTENYGTGIVAGGVIGIPICNKMKVQIEPSYNLHRSSINFDPYTDVKSFDLTLHQISVPLQLGYFVTPNLSINAGGSANYNFYFTQKAELEFTNPTFNITDEITKFQPGALGGITFYATDNVFIDGRYHRMLTNSYKRPTGDNWTEYQHDFFQVALGYRF